MNLGNSLYRARKNTGMSQEAVAEKLGVSRQTISKWETDETLPDIRQSKRLASSTSCRWTSSSTSTWTCGRCSTPSSAPATR